MNHTLDIEDCFLAHHVADVVNAANHGPTDGVAHNVTHEHAVDLDVVHG